MLYFLLYTCKLVALYTVLSKSMCTYPPNTHTACIHACTHVHTHTHSHTHTHTHTHIHTHAHTHTQHTHTHTHTYTHTTHTCTQTHTHIHTHNTHTHTLVVPEPLQVHFISGTPVVEGSRVRVEVVASQSTASINCELLNRWQLDSPLIANCECMVPACECACVSCCSSGLWNYIHIWTWTHVLCRMYTIKAHLTSYVAGISYWIHYPEHIDSDLKVASCQMSLRWLHRCSYICCQFTSTNLEEFSKSIS